MLIDCIGGSLLKKYFRGISFYILLFVVILMIFTLYNLPDKAGQKVYSDLISLIEQGQVKELEIIDLKAIATLLDDSRIEVNIPSMGILYIDVGDQIKSQMAEGTLRVNTPPPPTPPWWITILPTLGLVVFFILFWVFFLQQSQGGGGGRVMSFGRSRAKLTTDENKKKTTFNDVAGADEEKEELAEVVEFLKSPKKFIELGARIPKGVLLVGPPGTGKTLLAKAVSGEAGVPFFSISGSDFVEMFVGVGASRVRDLFEQAKKHSPCIVFIDEIDAVGRHRGAGLGGGHDEREQTLNQLLVEMDGFGVNEGVIVIAATNRPDILDPALLRPGRFDRQIFVGIPDIKGREAILKVHARGKPLDEKVELSVLAKTTSGFTGADLENLLNEAALLAARKSQKTIAMEELEEAVIKVIAGPEKKSRVISEKEKKLVAYHEAGHALVAKFLPTQDPVHQVSIIPRGRAGGYTLSLPKEDKYYMSKTEMTEDIVGLLGGRVAEKMALDDISTGAQNDIERATSIARKMVTKFGMSEKLGPIMFGSEHDEVFIGKDFAQSRNFSESVAAQIDSEIKSIIEDAYKKCQKLIEENINKLHKIAEVLLEKEKLDADEFEEVFQSV
jgi:cell division protease FtsH